MSALGQIENTFKEYVPILCFYFLFYWGITDKYNCILKVQDVMIYGKW